MSQSQEGVLLSAGTALTAAGRDEATTKWGGSAGHSHGATSTWLLRCFVFAELPESWNDMQEPLLEGMCFTLKYLGMTLVEKPKGEDMAAAAIRRIVATVRDDPGALLCWGGEKPVQSPAHGLWEASMSQP